MADIVMSDRLSVKEKLALWRSQKHGGHHSDGSAPTCAPKSTTQHNVLTWDRSMKATRRNNRILCNSGTGKPNSDRNICISIPELKDAAYSKENESPNPGSQIKGDFQSKEIDKLKNELKMHLQARQSASDNAYQQELYKLREEYKSLCNRLRESEEMQWEAIARGKMALEEAQALYFENDVLKQQIDELENSISTERLLANESAASKQKKHKLEITKLREEKSIYEDKTNDMITQLNDQMMQLQNMAMARINVRMLLNLDFFAVKSLWN
jgi:hypothetical protein